ncbi:MAG: flavodoxin domain-containing protein [Bacillaceae bacterium]|uniref:Flavodoxin domain-containing protein n=1 Tax=Alkalihalobacterium chitinilyticum TaxID=2980103 RepID=A0ABT5VG53_9BACI|nr:flavodoxin domain-containing protein [Alkalihalobacterium chitinilyticum]MDE5414426.1 flavodoxin domain-containing protein [Alkalihalobacterium chitinilyticum]MEB1807076.1 flavodoxin domain-containing protein [Bacillaceae bacterium]
MKCLIVYSTSHGTTEKASKLLSHYFEGNVELVDLNRSIFQPKIDRYDTIIIGGSIHLGTIQKKVRQFIKANLDQLLTKRVGLFLCCMNEGELAKEQFNKVYPVQLREHSFANGLFGGELLFSQMNFLERQIVTKVKGISSDVTNLNEESIRAFAKQMNEKIS